MGTPAGSSNAFQYSGEITAVGVLRQMPQPIQGLGTGWMLKDITVCMINAIVVTGEWTSKSIEVLPPWLDLSDWSPFADKTVIITGTLVVTKSTGAVCIHAELIDAV